MVEQQKETNSKKKWGVGLVVTPLVVWLLVAMANGFNFSSPWLGSKGADIFVGLVGVIALIVGNILWITATNEE